jgi:methionyl-tRNA formyltransferase
MRLLMMGTGPFALPTFRGLYQPRHSVVALVTRPVRTHRGRPVEPVSPLRQLAQEHGTTIFDPEDVNAADSLSRLAALRADLLVVCDYGQILAPATLAAARLGGINLHASLLPKYRGAAPINWAIYHGETETGVTVIHMTPQLDAGPSITQTRVAIGPDETAVELEARLAELGAGLICETIDRLESGEVQPIAQDAALASKAPRLKKTDGAIDWTRPAAAIKNQIRALEPWPKTYTFWHRSDGPPLRLILGPASVASDRLAAAGTASDRLAAADHRFAAVPAAACGGSQADVPSAAKRGDAESWKCPPGTVLEAAGDRLVIATGEGALLPAAIQPAGKREMAVAEFLRGHHVRPGDRFGPEN